MDQDAITCKRVHSVSPDLFFFYQESETFLIITYDRMRKKKNSLLIKSVTALRGNINKSVIAEFTKK